MRQTERKPVVAVEYKRNSDGTWSEAEQWPTVGDATSRTGAVRACRAAGYRIIRQGGTCELSPDGESWLVSVYG